MSKESIDRTGLKRINKDDYVDVVEPNRKAHLKKVGKKKRLFKWTKLSDKQMKVLTWWNKNSPVKDRDVIIADGAVRSGKTLIMSFSFVLWAMSTFNYAKLGMAGKTIGSFRRNVLFLLKIVLFLRGYRTEDKRSENLLIVKRGEVVNYFYIFGGNDERSQDLVQGFTSAGFLFDEVTLQPESFVNQAVARCSEEGAKLWFNCNPKGPFHWFKIEWIDNIKSKNAFRLHFDLDDNPSLSEKVKARYRRMFKGVFYLRYILGLWVMAEGLIYGAFKQEMIIDEVPMKVQIKKRWIGVDYGQANPTVYLLFGLGSDHKIYILDEYEYDGRKTQSTGKAQHSPSSLAKEFKKWVKRCGVEVDGVQYPVRYDKVYIDPSALGFILQLYEEKVPGITAANNDVNRGIELMASLIENDLLRVLKKCKTTIKEFYSYSWDEKKQEHGEDKPLKEYDHAMDAMRYFANGQRQLLQRLIVTYGSISGKRAA